MRISKLFNPKGLLLVAAIPLLGGCDLAGGIVAGVAAREAAEAAGADSGTADALGAAAALATIGALQQRRSEVGTCNTNSRTQTIEPVPNGQRVVVQNGAKTTPGYC
jgi:hypothetical protein